MMRYKEGDEDYKGAWLSAPAIALGSIYLTAQNVLSTLIGVFGYAFLARMITVEQMGAIAGLTLLTSLAQLISDFGLNSSLAKFVSELRGRGEDPSGHILSSLSFRIITSLALALPLFIFSTDISTTLFKAAGYSGVIRLLAIDSALISIAPLLNAVLWGSGKLKEMAIYGTASSAIRWLAIAAFLIGGYSLNGIVLGWVAGDAALLLMLSLAISKIIAFKRSLLRMPMEKLPGLLKFSWPIYLASATSFLYTWYDRALILAYLPLSQLGIYNIVYTAFGVLTSVSASLGSSLFPYYGMAYGRNDHKAITLGMKRASKYTMLAVFPLMLGLAVTARPAITLFAGRQYEGGWPILVILSLFGLVYGLSPAFSNLLLIYGRTKTMLVLNLTSVAISLSLLPLVWALGLAGLALMRGASLLLTFALSLYFISKAVKIEVDREAALKAMASSVAMAAIVSLVEGLSYDTLLLPLYVSIGAVTYVAAIRACKAVNNEDAQLIREVAGERAARLLTKVLGIG